MKSKNNKVNEPVVYIPPGAKINVDNQNMSPPPLEYRNRRKNISNFDVNSVKDLVGGKYKRDA